MDASDFEAVGLYDPTASDAEDRLAALEYLSSLGATADQMVAAAEIGGLWGAAADMLLEAGRDLTLEEVAERVGASVDQVAGVQQALGLPAPDPGERAFTERDEAMFAWMIGGGATGFFGAEEALQLLRVVGSSLARISDAAIAVYLRHVEQHLVRDGATELDHARANFEGLSLMTGLSQQLPPLLEQHARVAIARSRASRVGVRDFESARLAIGFVDLVGFTPLSQRLDPGELADVITRFEAVAIDTATSHGGRVVKLIGDEVMFVAVEPSAACEIALTLLGAFPEVGVTPRGGMAYGELLSRDGDYYGPLVNLASRIAELAVPNQILVTAELRATEDAAGAGRFEPAGRRMLKGFDEPVELYALSAV